MMVPRRRRQRRIESRGTVMVLFLVMTVVILGTIGLIIELGMVRVTRERMKSAADSTAMEVLRERDFVPEGVVYADDQGRDHGRRERNRHVAAWPFASQISATYEGESEAGAGSYVKMSSSQGAVGNEVHGGLVIEEVGHSVPSLRTNFSESSSGSNLALNKRQGDIVAGSFVGHEPGADVGFGDNPLLRENPLYERLDFHPPAEAAEAAYSDSVLVRLRRTKPYGLESTSPWNDDVDDVSSSGYTMPLIFGLGSTFLGMEPSSGYSIRHHGIPLRATSIAQARPAVRIGAPLDEPGVPAEWRVGAGPIALRWGEWMSDETFLVDPATGLYSAILRLRPPDYEIVSLLHDSFVAGTLYPKVSSQVGDLVDPNRLQPDVQGGQDSNLDPSYWVSDECYLPLYYFPSGTERRVCGFARVSIEEIEEPGDCNEQDCMTGDLFIKMTKLPNSASPGQPWVAPRNASATFDGTQPEVVFPSLSSRDWNDLIDRLYKDAASVVSPLYVFESRVYAPAHVR